MACNTIHRTLTVPLNRSERLSAFVTEIGRELAEALVPLGVDEFAGRRPAAGDAPQSGSARTPGSSP
jgi:hypothetical protein